MSSESLSSHQFLEKQTTQLEKLEQIILNEKLILQQHKPDALTEIIEQKNHLLLEIKSLDQQINLNQQFAQDKAAGILTDELVNIANLLDQCQQKNQVNGQIIQQSQLTVERMKTSLLERNNKSSITYDSKGKKSGGLSSIGLKA